MSHAASSAIPLTGADCFLRAFDDEVRRRAGASHASQLVLRLGPGFDLAAFESRLAEAAAAHPILHAPIRRRLGLGAPAYRLDRARAESAPKVRVHPHLEGRSLPDLFFARMNEPFRAERGELLRVDVVPRPHGTDLAMTWLHMLLDGAGSEAFVEWLESVHRGEREVTELPPDDVVTSPGLPAGLTFQQRGRSATAWQAWMASMAEPCPRSLAGPLADLRQDLRYDLLTLPEAETERVSERARQKAGFLTPMLFYLACAIRAHDAIFRERRLDPGAYVVPLPVNIRPKGSEHAIFRTRVSLLWFRVLPEQVRDLDGLIGELKRQRVDAIKAGRIEGGVIAMDFARWAPKRVYAHMARRAMKGELCSFFFAFTGEFAGGIDRFFGAPIENAFHAPPVPTSPGSVAAISLRSGRLNVSHVQQAGMLSDRERELFQHALRADLLGES
ncbi:MAG: hypothetical protein GY723_09370 [bacterium]|nr:hypothetical protein [bacterium]MCP5070143.1 hypothetical protein [bacterium]